MFVTQMAVMLRLVLSNRNITARISAATLVTVEFACLVCQTNIREAVEAFLSTYTSGPALTKARRNIKPTLLAYNNCSSRDCMDEFLAFNVYAMPAVVLLE